jgi:nitric oxide reductase subunit C
MIFVIFQNDHTHTHQLSDYLPLSSKVHSLSMNRKIFLIFFLLLLTYFAYSYFVYSHCDKKNTPLPDSSVLAGWKIWQKKNCQGCHQIYGLGGYMGPDLTNITSNPVKGPIYSRAFIQSGTAKMPNFKLTNAEVTAVVQFLAWVDKSGQSSIPAGKVEWNGNYNLEQ